MWTAHGRQHNKCIGWTLTRFLLPLCNHDLNFIQRKNFPLDQKAWIRQQDLSRESPCHIKQAWIPAGSWSGDWWHNRIDADVPHPAPVHRSAAQEKWLKGKNACHPIGQHHRKHCSRCDTRQEDKNLHYVQGVVDDLRWIITVLHWCFTTRPLVIANINNWAQRWEFVGHHQIV